MMRHMQGRHKENPAAPAGQSCAFVRRPDILDRSGAGTIELSIYGEPPATELLLQQQQHQPLPAISQLSIKTEIVLVEKNTKNNVLVFSVISAM
ncbi:hypothetical protein LINGRAHAP2_LOCUS21508 [Linum grandiflorum]